jgi:chemotaxis protein histidine kinase CheA
MSWADDPELVATFRAEVQERLASLTDGLLRLESHPSPRQLVTSLFRDAHTVKGSARMLRLDSVVTLAHSCEDLLGALRDGRLQVRRDIVDVLLVAVELLGRSLPGSDRPAPPNAGTDVAAALASALAGTDPVVVPRLADPAENPLPAHEAEAEDESAWRPGRAGEHVRVPVRRVHDLLDIVGEADLDVRRIDRATRQLGGLSSEHQKLVRELRSTLLAFGADVPSAVSDAATALVGLGDQLHAATRELRGRTEDASGRVARIRDAAMGLAMVPVHRVLTGFAAMVRELAAGTDKEVVLRAVGTDVELDARVLDGVADALRHLITNAVDHGCEPAAQRLRAGKPREATVVVAARLAGASVVIEVSDDGAGIDEEGLRRRAIDLGLLPADSTAAGPPLLRVLFEPGFSTRDDVTETSGRGVGLDVVRSAVEALGGAVELETTPGEGTRFVLTLPVSLGVARCLLVRCGQEQYALPLPGVVETISLAEHPVHQVAGSSVVRRRGDLLPISDLGQALGVGGARSPGRAVVFTSGGTTTAWAVDSLVGEREVVVKPLGEFLGQLPGVSGATIDNDGTLLLLLDLRELAGHRVPVAPGAHSLAAPPAPQTPAAVAADPTVPASAATGPDPARVGRRPQVLVVEDSVGVRELQRVILENAGYAVLTAVDGLDGASRLAQSPVDLVLSDVEMPGMDGFNLTRTIRRTRGWENVPVVIMTSRGDDADRRAGMDAGADAYLLKSEFDQQELVTTVRRLVGR